MAQDGRLKGPVVIRHKYRRNGLTLPLLAKDSVNPGGMSPAGHVLGLYGVS